MESGAAGDWGMEDGGKFSTLLRRKEDCSRGVSERKLVVVVVPCCGGTCAAPAPNDVGGPTGGCWDTVAPAGALAVDPPTKEDPALDVVAPPEKVVCDR